MPEPASHAAAIYLLFMEIGRYRCMAGSDAITPKRRELLLTRAAETERTMEWLKGHVSG